MRTASSLVLVVLAAVVPCVAQGDHLFTVCPTDGILRRVNPLTGMTYWSVQMVTSNNVNAQGCTGLACDPTTNQLYAIMREVGPSSIRNLVAVDANTGFATIIGAFSDNFAGIAFRSDGVLFAITGDGATVASTLWTVDTATAVPTLVMPLGNGGPGESICFGADGLLYHFSGCCIFNMSTGTILESIDTSTGTVTPITLSGFSYYEILGSSSWVGGNLIASDLYNRVLAITTGGVSSQIATFQDSPVKGVAFVRSPDTQAFFRLYGTGCAASSGLIPLITTSGTPSPGMFVQLDLLLSPANSPAVLALGAWTGVLPIPSAACQVQILPLYPDPLPFTTTAAGSWNAGFFMPPGLPSDIFLQIAVAEGGVLLVANPVQIHIL